MSRISRLLWALVAVLRGQCLLFPRLNTGLLRVYGRVRIRGSRRNLSVGRCVTFLGDATLVCGWDAANDRIELGDRVVIEDGAYLNAHGGNITVAEHGFIGELLRSAESAGRREGAQ